MSKEVIRYEAVHIRYEDSNIRYGEGCEVEVVTAADYDALLAERDQLRSTLIETRRLFVRDTDELIAERDALKDLLRGVYPHLCARRDEQDLDDAQQYVLAEECQELIDGIDAALQGEQP